MNLEEIKKLEERVKELSTRGSDGMYESIKVDSNYTIQGSRYLDIRKNLIKMDQFVKGKSVIDFGCNIGGICIDAKRLGSATTIGVDISSSFIKEAVNLVSLLNLDIKHMAINLDEPQSLETIMNSFSIRSFDVVFILSLWRHMSNFEKFARELNPLINEILVFEGHPIGDEKDICFKMLKEYFTFKEITYLGEADNCIGKPTGRPLFICRK